MEMARKRALRPVSIDGIEFDAFISSDDILEQDIPDYPTEEGFSVSDTIILKPRSLNITVMVGNIPVTWKSRHGVSRNRTFDVQNELEDMYYSRRLVTVKLSDATYYNMGVISMAIHNENSSIREIALSLKEVQVTERKTAGIPNYSLKSGETAANAGKAATSSTSSAAAASASSSGGSGSSGSASESKKAGSILYGAASSLGFV